MRQEDLKLLLHRSTSVFLRPVNVVSSRASSFDDIMYASM